MTVYPFAIGGENKICSKCKIKKQFLEFGKCGKSRLGIKSACKICLRKQSKAYAAKKRASMSKSERVQKAKKCKEWRENKLKENPNFWKNEYIKYQESCKKRQRQYYSENINKCRKAIRKYQNENRDKVREASNRWKKNNPEYGLKRRALKKNATINKFTTEELNLRMSVFGNKCAYCKGPFEHVDHVIPLSKGGAHCLANLRPACQKCNLSKSAKKLNDWLNEAA